MLLWIAIGGALVGALGRWRYVEARYDRAAAAANAERRVRRRRRERARITRVEDTPAVLRGLSVYRVQLELELGERVETTGFTRALTPAQLAWVKPGATLDVTYDPDELANLVSELEGRWDEEIGERVARKQRRHRRVELAAPLWAIGHDADAWLLPEPDAELRVVIGAFGGDADAAALALVAHLAADEVAFTTSARASVSLIVEAATHAVSADPDAPATPGALVVWGLAPRAAIHGEVALRFRSRHRDPPPPLGAALPELPSALAAALVDAQLAAPRARPAWAGPPRADAAAAYAQLVPGLVRQLLADPACAALAPLRAGMHAEIVTRALAHAHAHDDGQVHLAALACVYHAARAGAMTLEQRVYASELVGQYAGTGHPIDLLAPSYLVAFDLRGDARARVGALRGDTTAFRAEESAYHAWLARRFA